MKPLHPEALGAEVNISVPVSALTVEQRNLLFAAYQDGPRPYVDLTVTHVATSSPNVQVGWDQETTVHLTLRTTLRSEFRLTKAEET